MKTIEQTRRELFEAWLSKRPHVLNIGFRDGKYLLADDQEQWEAFNAALDAVVIELPSANNYTGCNLAIEDCRSAIESTSLGLKII